MTGETEPHADRLAAYHAIDPTVLVGSLPFSEYLAIWESTGDSGELGPGARLDAAWAGLEMTMAMRRDPNPATGQPFETKQINRATDSIRGEFRQIVNDLTTPHNIRVRAATALASIDIHHEIAQGKPSRQLKQNHLQYLLGLQRAGRLLFQNLQDPDALDNSNALTSLAVLNEYAFGEFWYVPAAPRQTWQISEISPATRRVRRVVISDEPQEECITIPRQALGEELWQTDESYVPFETLRRYIGREPGILKRTTVAKGTDKKRQEFTAFISGIFDRHARYLGEQARTEAVAAALGAIADLEHPTDRAEISWYLKQSSFDLKAIPPTTLRLHISNLESVMQRGELPANEVHALSWMQLDYARILAIQSNDTWAAAQRHRVQASRVSRYDAPPYIEQAEAAEARATREMEEADARFESAMQMLQAAIEGMDDSQAGERAGFLLDAEAFPVYRALYTNTPPDELVAVTNQYVQNVAALHWAFSETARKVARNGDQLDALYSTVLVGNFCLLQTASTEEAERHLVLPSSPRGGGAEGEADALVLELNYLEGTYGIGSPVSVHIETGSDVTLEHGRLHIGMDLLMQRSDPLRLFTYLTSVVRGNATRRIGSKPIVRHPRLDAFATRVADAIADAAQ